MKRYTLKDLAKSKVASKNATLLKKPNKPQIKPSKEKQYIMSNMAAIAKIHCLELTTEYKFHPTRKWRFDYCFKQIKLAIEYNGIMSAKSRHTTIGGYTGDMDKLNAAQLLGYVVLQYTPLNYKQCVKDVEVFINKTPNLEKLGDN